MCDTCGCGNADVHIEGHGHSHSHGGDAREIELHLDIMGKNDAFAARNRRFFTDQGILALNVVSSPGAGKTTLLEKTINALELTSSVIEGDQQTSRDADRIRATGAAAAHLSGDS